MKLNSLFAMTAIATVTTCAALNAEASISVFFDSCSKISGLSVLQENPTPRNYFDTDAAYETSKLATENRNKEVRDLSNEPVIKEFAQAFLSPNSKLSIKDAPDLKDKPQTFSFQAETGEGLNGKNVERREPDLYSRDPQDIRDLNYNDLLLGVAFHHDRVFVDGKLLGDATVQSQLSGKSSLDAIIINRLSYQASQGLKRPLRATVSVQLIDAKNQTRNVDIFGFQCSEGVSTFGPFSL
jgi:hypothetical protein